MAVTVSTGTARGRSGPNALGARKTTLLKVTFDSSYPTGGEAFDPKTYTGWTPAAVFVNQREPIVGGYVTVYDHTNKKLVVFWQTAASSALIEVTNTTNLSTLVLDVLLIGD